MFYKGFKIVNSLEGTYLKPLIRVANLYDMFERSSSSPEEVIIDYFYLKTKRKMNLDGTSPTRHSENESNRVEDLSADHSLEADDEYVRNVIESGNYMKMEDDIKEEGSDPKDKKDK